MPLFPWYYCLCQFHTCIIRNEMIWQVLWPFVTITINAMLHGLRQKDSYLGIRRAYTLSCGSIYVKDSPFSHRLLDVSVTNTAQDGKTHLWNFILFSSCNPPELFFRMLARIRLSPDFASVNIRSFTAIYNKSNVWTKVFNNKFTIKFAQGQHL